jgi:deoxyhypusine synthase
MTRYSTHPLELDRVKTYPLKSRQSKVSVKDFARVAKAKTSVKEWVKTLPNILAASDFRAVVAALEKARAQRKQIIWGLGGHVIKVGLGLVLMDLVERGYVTAVAMNGAALIHDFEIALAGATSEDVPAALGRGQFGMAEETGRFINEAIVQSDTKGLGIGESVGRFLLRYRGAQFRRYSLLAGATRRNVPVTVHQAIGTDIIHMHPATDARALGAGTHRDFRLLAALVKKMDGGVYLNVGSAVVLPEVFLKCVSLAANLGHAPRSITTVNMDFIQHYRPVQNVLLRPIQAGSKGRPPRRSYALTGHHELMIPLLAAALPSGRRARR